MAVPVYWGIQKKTFMKFFLWVTTFYTICQLFLGLKSQLIYEYFKLSQSIAKTEDSCRKNRPLERHHAFINLTSTRWSISSEENFLSNAEIFTAHLGVQSNKIKIVEIHGK